ncbi:hypothetical protein CMK18_20810 [Candidatus Poribacteria bacterium]|nr:hypothetical protein [Candidatus Poribacteria bacterium]
MFPHKKEIKVTNKVETFEISEVANEISLNIAQSRPLKPGEYVVLPEEMRQKYLPKAIVTNSTSDLIKQDRVPDQQGPTIYGVLADACLFGPYQMIALADGRFLREPITLNGDHVKNNHQYARTFSQEIKPQRVEVPVFRATHHHSQNYGHFLRDSLPLSRVRKLLPFLSGITSSVCIIGSKFIGNFFARFGPDDTYLVNHGVSVETPELHFVSQPPISFSAMDYLRSQGIEIVKNDRRDWRTVAKQTNSYVPAIYVSRMGSRRAIKNETDLIPLLEKYNIRQITPHELTVMEQMHLFSNTHFLIGAWGASLCNCVFMPEHSIVLELCDPSRYLDSWYTDFVSYSRCHYGKIVGEAPSGHQYLNWEDTQSDFTISPELLDEVLNEILGKFR